MAKVKIDLDRRIGRLDRRVFGGFVEHLGRCIYGGIFDESSSLSDERGYRRDVLEAVKNLRIPILRWPGGNFVSGYHWTDGVGPREERPRRMNLAWYAEESNHFGTDEFIEYCRTLDTEPYICINMGTGTMDEAAAWVEYCNGAGDTYWANLRRENGHEEPHGVKYWALGNEMYGSWQIGALSAEDYVKNARQFAKVMKRTDPSIELVSCGLNGWSEWDRIVVEGLASLVEYHSIHLYTGSDDYWSNVLAPHQAGRALDTCRTLIDRARHEQGIERSIYVAYDEWNVWFREQPEVSSLEERYTLSDAVAVATYLNIFFRHCGTVKIANLAQMVNVLAPIVTGEEGLFLQTIYHPLRLYAEHARETVLNAYVDCETHDLRKEKENSPWPHRVADLGPFDMLDVAATYDVSEHAVALFVVNRDPERDTLTTVQLADARFEGEVKAWEVTGPAPDAINSFEEQHVKTRERSVKPSGRSFEHTLPACSVTVFRAKVSL